MAGEQSAATVYRWLRDLQAAVPQAVQIIEAFYKRDKGGAIAATSAALGVQVPKPTVAPKGSTLYGWFEEVGAAALDAPSGQVMVPSIWSDSPVVKPATPFKVVWQEENIGGGETGPYKAALVVNSDVVQTIDLESLPAKQKVNREARLEKGLDEGTYTITVFSPWYGDFNSRLETQAGRTTGKAFNLAIGGAASDRQQNQERQREISAALGNAMTYMAMVDSGSKLDTSNIQYALQAIANVAPSLDGTLDLQSKAAQMMVRDPKTVGPEAVAEAKAKARDAVVALTTAQTRIGVDMSDPVDHPATLEAAKLVAAIADLIIQAPVVEATA